MAFHFKSSSHTSRHLLLLAFVLLTHTSFAVPAIPADHLVPPPLPTPQHLKHQKSLQYASAPAHLTPSQPLPQDDQHSGFMTRIARWFGLGAAPEQQLASSTNIQNNAYSYAKPTQNGEKAGCNLCNKYPWIPMLPFQVQYQQQPLGQASQKQLQRQPPPQQQGYIPTGNQQQLPVKQRAVQFNYPGVEGPQFNQYQPLPITGAIPLPSLSLAALPPLYNAAPFRVATPEATVTATASNVEAYRSEQELPSTEVAHFAENEGAHSELQPHTAIPTQIPPSINGPSNANVEIIRSQQLTDFVSAVEYPATYVQSTAIDVSEQQQQKVAMPQNHKPETTVATAKYQFKAVNQNLNGHIPASKLLTELGANYGGTQETTQQTTTFAQSGGGGFYETSGTGGDNSPAASSPNHTNIHQNYVTNFYSTGFQYSTPTFSADYERKTPTPPYQVNEFITEPSEVTSVQFVPSLQTNDLYQGKAGRDTPKRLLDAPIRHLTDGRGQPRPFTRDPSELNLRFHGNLKELQRPEIYTKALSSIEITPSSHVVSYTTQPSLTSHQPTSTTSTITTAMPHTSPHVHQIIIPYTTKNRPRPFEPSLEAQKPDLGPSFAKWKTHTDGVDFHEQQESKVVSAQLATEAPPNARRTTKYVTKILAANLRELLRREHEVKKMSQSQSTSSNFDLSKLQKNIDDWTEQEYTSLSHRPSTPTIRGRSKHIPAEYLTSTPALKSPNTTENEPSSNAELPASINNLESKAFLDRASKRLEYTPINHNYLFKSYEKDQGPLKTPAQATPAPLTTTTARSEDVLSSSAHLMPQYVRSLAESLPQESAELWRKAKVAISPQTHEKVYVVTPQPLRFVPQRHFAATSGELARTNKPPRFLVRPTPGSGPQNTTNSSSSLYRPELFGLMGLSAFVPAKPVEIIDGNSKVASTNTASPTSISNLLSDRRSIAKESKKSHTMGKPTMSPSPR